MLGTCKLRFVLLLKDLMLRSLQFVCGRDQIRTQTTSESPATINISYEYHNTGAIHRNDSALARRETFELPHRPDFTGKFASECFQVALGIRPSTHPIKP